MLIHLNNHLIDHAGATVSVFDRGFIFGDGVYEGIRTTADAAGRPRIIGERLHIERMRAGLAEARITTFDPASLAAITDQLVRANNLVEAFIYWQVTRGTPPGDAAVNRPRVTKTTYAPTVLGIATPVPAVRDCLEPEPRRVALRPDTRWLRGRLKSTSLLGNIIAAIEADEAGADDAILIRDNLVVEGTATNVFLSSRGRLFTPSLDSAPMLAGVTRQLLIDHDPSIEQRPVRAEELLAADEVMLVGTKSMVSAVTHIESRPVGTGRPGAAARQLLGALRDAIAKESQNSQAPRC